MHGPDNGARTCAPWFATSRVLIHKVDLCDYDWLMPAESAIVPWCDPVQWDAWVGHHGGRPLHARRIIKTLARKPLSDLADVELPRSLRVALAAAPPLRSRIAQRQVAADGTVKLLVQYPDGLCVEAVLMNGDRPGCCAACLSSQIGCAMACDFCATARGGLRRNLSADEIVEQFFWLNHHAEAADCRIASVVYMGMGEPLANLAAAEASIRFLTDPRWNLLGPRQITVSTVGIPAGIARLAEAQLGVHLAWSLHAADDALRRTLLPAAGHWPIAQTLTECRRFMQQTNRYVTISYCLLRDVNDSPACAAALSGLLAASGFHVNLIPLNQIGTGLSGAVYHPSDKQTALNFQQTLIAAGLPTHIRRRRGQDIAAACGQLQGAHAADKSAAPYGA